MNTIKYMLEDAKKRRVIFSVIAVMSVFAALTVFFVLQRPGEAMTADCISYDADGYPVVTIPEDAEVTTTGQNTSTSYNCKYTLYNVGDGYILYLEPYDPEKSYSTYTNGVSSYKSEIKAVKAAPGLTKINNSAFSSWSALVTADFSECTELSYIGTYAFNGCSSLESVNFAQDCGITTLVDRTFYNCTSLKSFPFERLTNLESISAFSSGYAPFGNCAFETVDLSANTKLTTLMCSFCNCTSLKTVVFPENSALTSIGQYAFYGCTVLSDFPFENLSNVETVGYNAFSGCKALTEADMSSWTKLTAIPNYMFQNCTSLETVKFPENNEITSIGQYAFSGCTVLSDFPFENLSNVENVGIYAFYDCKALTEADMSSWTKLTAIPGYMFYNCYSLETVDLSGSSALTTIGNNAFYQCYALETVDLSGSSALTTIGNNAFYQCYALETVDMPENSALTSIGGSAFYQCTALKNFSFENCPEFSSIGSSAFSFCLSLETVDLSNCKLLASIPSQCFMACKALSEVKLPEDSAITFIGSGAFSSTNLSDFPFENLTNLEKIASGDGRSYYVSINGTRIDYYLRAFAYTKITNIDLSKTKINYIGDYAFWPCPLLESVVLPENSAITYIGQSAFSGCTVLSDFTFENLSNVETVGASAFSSCKALTEADMSSWTKLTAIPSNMFDSCSSLETVKLPENSEITSIEKLAFSGCTVLSDFPFENLSNVETVGYNAFSGCKALTEADMSSWTKLTAIPRSMFDGCSSLETVKLPENSEITSIEIQAFSGCTVLSDFPFENLSNVETIGNNAFNGCKALTEADMSNLTKLKTIGSSVFYNSNVAKISLKNCTSLTDVSAFGNSSGLTTVDFSGCSSLTALPASMFSGYSKLKTVKLDGCDSLTSIGNNAFKNCSELTEIELPAGLTTIGSTVFTGCTNLKTINYNAENLTTVGTDAFKGLGVLKNLTVNIGANVDTVCEGVFAEGMKIKTVNFKGPNESLVIGKDAFKTCGRPLAAMSDGVTEYYVDENGVVYSKDKTTLYYVPAGIETFTVPANVTTVKKNCLAKAADLISLEFEDISKLEKAEARAFANCPTLTSVTADGKTATTVEDAEALFGADTSVGKEPFYNTGLIGADFTGELTSDVVNVNTTIKDKDGNEAIEYELSLFVNNSGNRGTLDSSCMGEKATRVPSIDEDKLNDNVYYYLTQQDANLTVSLSSTSARVNKCARVYFNCSNDAVLIHNFEVGKTVKISTSSEGSDKVITFDVTLHQVEPDTYYLEFPALYGGTLSMDLSLYVPNLTEQNTTVRTWVQLCESMDSELDFNPEKYQQLQWYTAIHKTTLTHTTSTSTMNFKQTEEADGSVGARLNGDITFSTKDTITSSSVEGFGIDPIRTIAYSEYLTLPDGMEWESWVKEAIENGKWYVSGTSPAKVMLKTENGDIELMEFSSEWSAKDIDLKWDEEKGVVLTWNRLNTSLGAASGGSLSQEIGTLNGSFTFNADEIFRITDEYDFTSESKIVSNISKSVEYVMADKGDTDSHSEELFEQSDDASATLGTAKPILGIKKTLDPLTKDNKYGGEECDFIIEVSNTGIVEGNYIGIYDQLPVQLTMRAEHIEKMFAEYGNVLQITINDAYCDTTTKEKTVIDADGNEKVIDRNDMGTNDELTEMKNFYVPAIYSNKNIYCDIAFTTEDNGKTLKVQTANGTYTIGEGCDYASVQEFFDGIGFVDYSGSTNSNSSYYKTKYRCDWFEEKRGDKYIASRETRTYHVYSEYKHIFECEYIDYPESFSASTQYNYAYLYYYQNFVSGSMTLKSASVYPGYSSDFAVYKSYSVNGTSSAKTIGINDVVDYKVEIRKYGTDVYDTLPVYDTMSGSQAILVPVEGNDEAIYTNAKDKSVKLPEAGLKTYTAADGTEYYILSNGGTYTGVMFGEIDGKLLRTDKITVKKNNCTLDTDIYWYLSDLAGIKGGYVSSYIDYKTIVREDLGNRVSSEDELSFGSNYVYLNGRGNHRLYDYVGDGDNIAIAQIFSFDKNIVTANAALENEQLDKDQEIARGQSVTYKLELHNRSEEYPLNVTGAYDLLPQTYGEFAWSKDNVSMKAISSLPEGNTTADVWRISDKDRNGETTGRYYIYWNDSETEDTAANITLQPNESLYIYVTLDFPDDSSVWSGYENDAFNDGNKLYNDFYVGERKARVEHQLKASGEAILQKGVYGIYNSGTNMGDRTVYTNQSTDSPYVTYYVTIYNSGNARLYLTDITDVLPKGFEYRQMCAVSDYGTGIADDWDFYGNDYIRASRSSVITNADYNKYYIRTFPYDNNDKNKLDRNNLLTYIEDGDKDIQYMQAYIKQETVSTTNADGETQQKLKFSVYQDHPSLVSVTIKHEKGNIAYDEERGLCYLEKGQALVFGYQATPGRISATDDIANNRVSMQYYDYNESGNCKLSQNVKISSNYANYLESVNEGSAYLTDDFEASTGGFDGPYGTDWLTSDVTLNRGQIVPGVEKALTAVVDDKGETKSVSNGALISPSDTAVWTVTMTNEGTNVIEGYTITDEMQAPYYFTGDVCYYIADKNNKISSSTHHPSISGGPNPTWKDTNTHALLMDVEFIDAEGNKIEDSIENIGKENVWVKFKVGEDHGTIYYSHKYTKIEYVVKLGEEKTITPYWAGNYNESVTARQDFTVLFDVNEKGNCTLDITVVNPDKALCIPSGGKAVLTVQTKKPSTLLAYDSYINTADFIPEQYYDPDAVSKGAIIRDENDNPLSIESTSMLTLSGAYATISWKEIADNSDPTNTASSLDTSDNYIVLKWDETKEPPYSDFTYSLNVQNKCNKPLYKMVIIDNLPDKGDFGAYSSGTVARNSQFEVSLTGTDVFTVSDGTNTLERVDVPREDGELAYTVEFSRGVDFTDDDWSGNDTEQWLSADEVNTLIETGEIDLTDIRSYRIIVCGDAEHGITEGGTLKVTANARISGESVKPNEIAWNNFGYKYYVNVSGNNNFSLSASSLNVGVKTATIPKIKKELVSPTGAEVSAERLGFGAEFIVYENKGSALIEFTDDQDLMKKLDEGGYKFTCVKLTPEQLFDSDGDGSVVSLTDCKVFTAVSDDDGVYSCVESDGEDAVWRWTEDSKYTFVEVNIPEDMVFSKMNNSQRNGCTITYKPSGSYTVYCINNYDDYSITLRKTDSQTRSALSGAAFARYGVLTDVPENESDERMEQLWSEGADKYIEASQMLNDEGEKRLTLSAPNAERLNSAKDKGFAEYMSISGVSAQITDMNDAGNDFCQFYTIDNGDGTLDIYYFIDYNVTDERGYISYIGITDDVLAFREIAAPQSYRLNYAMIAADRTAGCGETQYIDIADLRVAELPMTGGNGTVLIVCAGIFLMISANASIIIRAVRRRRSFSDPCEG